MTKEEILESQSIASGPWIMTDELRERAAQAREGIEKAKENFEKLEISCPEDGSLSKFARYEGAYTRVRGVFKCENGHEFYYG